MLPIVPPLPITGENSNQTKMLCLNMGRKPAFWVERGFRSLQYALPPRGTILNTWYLVGLTVDTKNYIFSYFYEQYLVLFTMASRNSVISGEHSNTGPSIVSIHGLIHVFRVHRGCSSYYGPPVIDGRHDFAFLENKLFFLGHGPS